MYDFRHDNYYRTSEWLSGSSSAVLGESLSSHNLERIVRAITTLLTSDNLVLKESRYFFICTSLF